MILQCFDQNVDVGAFLTNFVEVVGTRSTDCTTCMTEVTERWHSEHLLKFWAETTLKLEKKWLKKHHFLLPHYWLMRQLLNIPAVCAGHRSGTRKKCCSVIKSQ